MSGCSTKAFLFDLDDTLYDERTFVASGFRAVAAYLSARFGLDGEILFSAMMEVFSNEGRGKVFDRVLERLGLCNPALVRDLVHVYRFHWPRVDLCPDVLPVLAALRKRGMKVGIVTDGMHAVQRQKVAALGLADWVDVIVCTDELGPENWKPAPTGFLVALDELGVTPAEAVYVGNDASKDFTGPRLIGMRGIHIVREGSCIRGSECEAQLHIACLEELWNRTVEASGTPTPDDQRPDDWLWIPHVCHSGAFGQP